jgi:two-component system C4-dicarboxylate transport response regulator DctD
LFLDEIDSMPCALQVKLLRVLQEQEIERLGSNTPIAVDCRVVAAAKDDLGELSRQNRFRGDLYYRLNVVPVELPPLRDRREDIPLLFEHFVLQAALRFGRDAPIISSAQMRELLTHNWPGNVRELHNMAIRCVLGLAGQTLVLRRSSEASAPLSNQMRQFERCLIELELRKQNGCVAAASQALGLPKATLYDKIRKHQLASEDSEKQSSGQAIRLARTDSSCC